MVDKQLHYKTVILKQNFTLPYTQGISILHILNLLHYGIPTAVTCHLFT